MTSSDFVQGMRTLSKRFHPYLKLDPEAIEALARMCADLNDKLVKETRNSYKSGKKKSPEGPDESNAEAAAKKVIKSRIKDFADAAAHRYVEKFKSQEIRYSALPVIREYQEELKEAARMKALIPKPFGHEFFPGLKKLLSCTHGDGRLDAETQSFFGNWIKDNIILFTKSADSRDGKIGAEEMQKAVASKLGPEMAALAHSEGMQRIALFSHGLLILEKEKEVPDHVVHVKHGLSILEQIHHGKIEEEEEVLPSRAPENFVSVFSSGIKRLAANVVGGNKLDVNSTKVINDLLENVCTEIAHVAVSRAPHTTKSVGPIEVESAVHETLKGKMVEGAQSEGRRILTLYANGMIAMPNMKAQQHDQKSKKASKPCRKRLHASAKTSTPHNNSHKQKSQSKKSPKIDYTPGVLALIAELNSMAIIDRPVGEYMNKILESIVEKLCLNLGVDTKEVTVNNIREAVRKTFPGKLQFYADLAGNNSIVMASGGEKPNKNEKKKEEKSVTFS